MILLIYIPLKFMVSLTNMLPLNSLIIFQTLLAQREIKKVETVQKEELSTLLHKEKT